MATDDADDVVKAGRVGQVPAHLGAPSLAVAFYGSEPRGEGAGVDVLGPSFALEERSDLGDRQGGVLGEPEQVVEVAALHTLDETAQLLGPDLLDGVDGEGNGTGEVWPDPEDGPFLDGLDVLVGGEVELDLARPGGAKWAEVRDGRFVLPGELESKPAWSRAAFSTLPTAAAASSTLPSVTVKSRSAE